MAEQCTMQKYPLGLSNSPLPPTALHPPPSSPLAISQLFFCGFEDKFLITTLASGASKPIVVWDLRRGAVQHDIPLPPKTSLLPARFGGPCAAPPLSPPPEHADSKLVVYVHDLDSDKARLVAKVKIVSTGRRVVCVRAKLV